MRKVWTRAHEWQRLIEAVSGRGRARCISYFPTGRRVRRRVIRREAAQSQPQPQPQSSGITMKRAPRGGRDAATRRAASRRGRGAPPILSARGTVNTRGVIITGAPGLTETRRDERVEIEARSVLTRADGERLALDAPHSRISYVRRAPRNRYSHWRG